MWTMRYMVFNNTQIYVLEYKESDSKGREKNAKFVGVYNSISDVDNAKKKISEELTNKKISFQTYKPQTLI